MSNYYRFEGDRIHFRFPFCQETVDRIKWISGASWNSALKEWVVPIIEQTADKIADFMEDYGFIEYDNTLKEVKQTLEYDAVDYAHLEGKISMLDLKFKPRDYQLQTVAYTLDKRNVLNALDMGLGKSFCSILAVELDKAFPCLIIAPASVKYQFAEAWTDITGRKSVSVIESKETKKRKNDWGADVVVINYELLGKLVDNGRRGKHDKVLKDLEFRFPELLSTDWKSVIADEAHFCKNPKAARSCAVKKIVKGVDLIQFLTGTPVSSKPKEIINLLNMLGKFESIAPNWDYFVHRYCNAHHTGFSLDTNGASNLIELNQKMRNECYIRFEKRDVLTELPPVSKTVLNVPLSNKKEYFKALNDTYGHFMELGGVEKAMKSNGAEALTKLNTLRQLVIKGKMKAIEQYIKDWKEGSDEKLIIFAEHREPILSLAEKFKSEKIMGGVSSEKKRKIVKDFSTSDDQFLFCNMKASGTGTDGLQDSCSNMLIIELTWNPDLVEQVISRLDRSGQKFSTNVNFILCEDTIDDYMWEVLAEKEVVADAVNRGVDVEETGESMKNIAKMLFNDLEVKKT